MLMAAVSSRWRFIHAANGGRNSFTTPAMPGVERGSGVVLRDYFSDIEGLRDCFKGSGLRVEGFRFWV